MKATTRDRRIIHLAYSRDSKIRHHYCAPGLGGPVRRYLSETYGAEPIQVRRLRSLVLDPGGFALMNDPWVRVPMDGWTVRVRMTHVPGVIDVLRHRMTRPLKDYAGTETIRVPGFHCIDVLRPADVPTILAVLRSRTDEGLTRRTAKLHSLVADGHVLATGLPTPGAEA